ncbi:DUF1778 domain-containing protein [Sphingomonas sp. MMSM24]|uniref:DUF1778 domain-containing protein n=1 Tax=Sphingomonas lycopersici TaxID=2951807 RepID=A0AA41ZAL8_9SPHN|nr:DUF1778 domain-containing protein [Sphingomonas lycopersici]MCW6536048.1 DUF1778 domain-containing protein [Sphingomonas lycopersici]
MIQRAAEISGLDSRTFVINAAYRAAAETIAVRDREIFQFEDQASLFELLEEPAQAAE